MNKSNIRIAPNIYVRDSDFIDKDLEYVKHITGYKIIKELNERYCDVRLNEIQKRILHESIPCLYSKDGEMAYGMIKTNGMYYWSCRCELDSCKYFSSCHDTVASMRIIRSDHEISDVSDQPVSDLSYENLGIKLKNGIIDYGNSRTINEISPIESENDNANDYALPTEPNFTLSDNDDIIDCSTVSLETSVCYNNAFRIITEPSEIITSDVNSHILLNSGPGTGKTYTILQRLIFLLKNGLCAAENIVILCYTRAARTVILDKINSLVISEELDSSAINICILTFDSYASYFLFDMNNEINEDVTVCSYDKRIKLFNKYSKEENFESIEYFIVDEIQDLVNDRAEMVLGILEKIKCGYLLAGDRCQAIYDFEADKDAHLDSTKFYSKLNEILDKNTVKYEICVNKRQSRKLAEISDTMRNILLHNSILEQNIYASGVFDIIDNDPISFDLWLKDAENETFANTAILCRSNGEAENINTYLCSKKIPHIILRGADATQNLNRWAADVFWDYCEAEITVNDFVDRCIFRTGDTNESAQKKWNDICRLIFNSNGTTLKMIDIISIMRIPNTLPDFFFDNKCGLIVSTVHKAKGREFDDVILLDSDITDSNHSAEEARIRYVALTRAKKQIICITKSNPRSWFFKKTRTDRAIKTGKLLYKKRCTFCQGITVGLSGDIDSTSFLSDSFNSSIELQKYIFDQINVYDTVNAVRNAQNDYIIYHNGRMIGKLSDNMKAEIKAAVEATDLKYNMPDELSQIYISAISTEILYQHCENIPIEYKKSHLCYGIQITGFAKLKFN